jgi:hypothetical protein
LGNVAKFLLEFLPSAKILPNAKTVGGAARPYLSPVGTPLTVGYEISLFAKVSVFLLYIF